MIGRDESSKTYSVIPFLDVLSFGNETQKRQALAKMTSHFHPNFAPAFKKALSDDSNTIRVQAATAITKIENQFTERLMKLAKVKEQYEREPVVVLALAEHYDNYAYTGLLDADREQANRQRAFEHYQEYLELDPQSLDVRTRVGRILMRNKEFDKACEWFRKCADLGYVSEAIFQWYSEALFECGRYDELRRLTASSHQHPATQTAAAVQPFAVKEALGLWSSSAGSKI
jgi:tetratricopeptide (TPR) repeat protein